MLEFINTAIKPTLLLLSLAIFFSILLAYFGTKLAVKQDERIDYVNKKLSGANCGGCGCSGCADFARALVEGRINISECPSTSKENKSDIANYLGLDSVGGQTKIIVACNGGNRCKDKYSYQGYGDCNSMSLLAGGRKACDVGCMGTGSCTNACHNNAIKMGEFGYASINYNNCINCGLCVTACPKSLIVKIPKDAKIYIACKNCDKGADVKRICEKGCISCGLCSKICPEGAIIIQDNLPIIDYTKCTGCLKCSEKCPTKVINIL